MNITAPVRVAHTYTQNLNAAVDRVFPLLCPVREADWIEGWAPSRVMSATGRAERGCVFITGSGADEAVWVVTVYEPKQGRIEFVKTTPGVTVTQIAITVRPVMPDSCTAEITYQHTALSPAGEAAVSAFTASQYQAFMRTWENRLNHYLMTGQMLRTLDA